MEETKEIIEEVVEEVEPEKKVSRKKKETEPVDMEKAQEEKKQRLLKKEYQRRIDAGKLPKGELINIEQVGNTIKVSIKLKNGVIKNYSIGAGKTRTPGKKW